MCLSYSHGKNEIGKKTESWTFGEVVDAMSGNIIPFANKIIVMIEQAQLTQLAG